MGVEFNCFGTLSVNVHWTFQDAGRGVAPGMVVLVYMNGSGSGSMGWDSNWWDYDTKGWRNYEICLAINNFTVW